MLQTVSGWVNREQLRTIEYLIEENRVLKEQFKGRRLRLKDAGDGILLPHPFLIIDRDSKFSDRFRRTLRDAGVETVLAPCRAPNCSANAERFVRSIKEECLDRMIFFGEGSLHRAICEFVEHYHRERPHQGFDNEVIDKAWNRQALWIEIQREERLGGLLWHYRRAAQRWALRFRLADWHPRLSGPVHGTPIG